MAPGAVDATPSGVLVSDWIATRGCAKSSAYKWLGILGIRPRREVNRATGKVESWLTDEQAATLTAYAEALSKGAKPSEALAVIGRGPVVAAPQVPGWMPPAGWEPMAPEPESADSEDDAYDALELLGKRLRALRDAVELGAPLTTREVRLLLGANPGAEQVSRAGVSARRLARNLWQLSRATEARRERW
ncbi:MAG: hypothetical protein RLZZ168_917 [Cyanobacteriota bacterium]